MVGPLWLLKEVQSSREEGLLLSLNVVKVSESKGVKNGDFGEFLDSNFRVSVSFVGMKGVWGYDEV